MNRTRVRVRDTGKGHSHHTKKVCEAPPGFVRPEWIVIVPTPVEPDYLTLCDTQYLWRVPDDEVLRVFGAHPTGPAYVCEHQVEID